VSPHYDFHATTEILISEKNDAKKRDFWNEVTSFFCIGKGRTVYSLSTRE
jgi:hypothetical protein